MLTRTMMKATTVALAAAIPLLAQSPGSRGAVRVTAGYSKQYLDEPWHPAVGASVRFKLIRRFSVEPEFVASRGRRFRQWTLIPNIVYDLRGSAEKLMPYVIGGIGYFSELDKSINYKRKELAWNGGVGVRVGLAGGLFVAPEFRLGHITRAAVGIGYQF